MPTASRTGAPTTYILILRKKKLYPIIGLDCQGLEEHFWALDFFTIKTCTFHFSIFWASDPLLFNLRPIVTYALETRAET